MSQLSEREQGFNWGISAAIGYFQRKADAIEMPGGVDSADRTALLILYGAHVDALRGMLKRTDTEAAAAQDAETRRSQ